MVIYFLSTKRAEQNFYLFLLLNYKGSSEMSTQPVPKPAYTEEHGNLLCEVSSDIVEQNLTSLNNSTQLVNSSQAENIFDGVFFNFLCHLHAEPSLSKKLIDNILYKVKDEIIEPLLRHLDNDELKYKIENDFESINTFYKFQKELKERKMISKPKQVVISERVDLLFRKGKPSYESVKDKVSIMPVREQIRSFLQIPNIFKTLIDNIRILENTQHKSFFGGILWQNIKSKFQQDDIVIPCLLYHDDFEPDNPLSSNAGANKIAAFYYTFPAIPQHLNSLPKYIFDAMVFNSALKKNELDLALKPLINEFIDLETNGIILEIDGQEKKVYIVLCVTVGDNLAQHELLGYNTSFNAIYSCRFCKAPKCSIRKDTTIKIENIRNELNYQEDLQNLQHGVIKECLLSELNHFQVTQNYSVDIMHDIFEGVARYDVALFLKYIIYDQKIINLRTFNKLKQEFDYGAIEIGNMGPQIKEEQIKGNCLIMSASEMRNFLYFLPFMIGHEIIDEKHQKHWKMICGLILNCRSFNEIKIHTTRHY